MLNNTFAVIDLGSNSFHLLVVENINGLPRVVSKVKRKVRLASGLDEHHVLSAQAMERGWQCLALFGEHLTELKLENVTVVATATLRLATNANEFCLKGRQLLGTEINIISGEQEAALIYQGMAVTSNAADKRLIIDIGGASTELVLGEGLAPLVLKSMNMGCVTWLERYFADGLLSIDNFEQAMAASRKIVASFKDEYLAHQWQLTLGASGSVQAVQEILIDQGYGERITLDKLMLLMTQCIACQSLDKLSIKGLKPERVKVFASGLSILIVLFQELAIDGMLVSGGALREGVTHQLMKVKIGEDIGMQTCQALQSQFNINPVQAQQVSVLASRFANEINVDPALIPYLSYAAMLHEIGLSLNYQAAPQHGQYMLSQLSLPGFSEQQRRLLVALVGNYKGEIKGELLQQQQCCPLSQAQLLLSCLRLAVIGVGRLQGQRCADIHLSLSPLGVTIQVKEKLAQQSPLLMAQLSDEVCKGALTTL